MKSIPCPVSVDRLRELYVVDKLTDQQIVKCLAGEATIKRVRSWRRRHGIGTICRSERHEVPPIEGKLRSLLVGSMLGDGRLVRHVHATYYVENHCEAQRKYADWKRQQWGSWVKHELKPVVWRKAESRFAGVRFSTVAHAFLNEWQALFYPVEGPKRLCSRLVPLVDELALGIWYLDDGCAGWWPSIAMATIQREVALEILLSFNLSADWRFSSARETTGFYVIRGEANALRFIDLIRSQIPNCMRHKLQFGFQGPHFQARQLASKSTLVAMASRGVPIKRMARELGVGASTVGRYMNKFAVQHPRRVGRPLDTYGKLL